MGLSAMAPKRPCYVRGKLNFSGHVTHWAWGAQGRGQPGQQEGGQLSWGSSWIALPPALPLSRLRPPSCFRGGHTAFRRPGPLAFSGLWVAPSKWVLACVCNIPVLQSQGPTEASGQRRRLTIYSFSHVPLFVFFLGLLFSFKWPHREVSIPHLPHCLLGIPGCHTPSTLQACPRPR